jgi:hypothetical protein
VRSQCVERGEMWITPEDRDVATSQRGSAPWPKVVDDDGRRSWGKSAAWARARDVLDIDWCWGWWCRYRRKRWASSDRRTTSDIGGREERGAQ